MYYYLYLKKKYFNNMQNFVKLKKIVDSTKLGSILGIWWNIFDILIKIAW